MAIDRYHIVGNWPVPGGTAPAILDPLNRPQSPAVADACKACGQPPCALVCIFEEFGIYTECVLRLLNRPQTYELPRLPRLRLFIGEVVDEDGDRTTLADVTQLGYIEQHPAKTFVEQELGMTLDALEDVETYLTTKAAEATAGKGGRRASMLRKAAAIIAALRNRGVD